MQCPPFIFNKFLAVCGGGTGKRECIEFAAEAMASSDAYYPDIILLHFGDISHEDLNDWNTVDTWISDLQLGLDLLSVFPENEDDIYDESQDDCYSRGVLPYDLVQDVAGLKSKVLRAIKSGFENPSQSELIFSNTVSCVTISCGPDKLELVFTDLYAWDLGHSDWITVVSNLSELSEADGYYQL
jgi:hypothetical protein